MRGDVGQGAVQRIARLLLMIGFVLAAFIVLSFFDQAARADEGLTDRLGNTDPPASAEKLASDIGKDRSPLRLTERKGSARQAEKRSASRVAGRKAAPVKVERRKAVAPKPQGRSGVPKVRERGSPASVVETRLEADGGRVATPRVELRKVPVPRAYAGRASARHVAAGQTAPGFAAMVPESPNLRLTAEREAFTVAVRAAPALPTLPRPPVNWQDRALPVLPVVGALPTLAAVSSVPLPPVPTRLASPAADQLFAPPARPQGSLLSATTPMAMALPTVSTGSDLSEARIRCDLAEQGRVRHDGSGLSPAPTTPPPPTSPPRPGDRSADAGHLRASGGGTAPPMGTVPSSWWPEIPAADVVPPANASTPGRTVRHCGPPS